MFGGVLGRLLSNAAEETAAKAAPRAGAVLSDILPQSVSAAKRIVGNVADEPLTLAKPTQEDMVNLYRGMSQKFDPNYDLNNTGALNGYTYYTDNPSMAREYAGKDGYVYQYQVPKSSLGDDIMNEDGDRVLAYKNSDKKLATGTKGGEYMVYNDHENYDPNNVKLYEGPDDTLSFDSNNSTHTPVSSYIDSANSDLEDAIKNGEMTAGDTPQKVADLIKKIGSDSTQIADYTPDDWQTVSEWKEAMQNGAKIPPVVLGSDGYVVDGSHRLMAYNQLGTPEIPVAIRGK